jgi:hypothetical protein
MTIMRNAQFRILPPQPASLVSIGQHAKARQNRAVPRHSQIPRGLRVANWPTEVPLRPLVSEATFWCLVFPGS